MAKRVFRSEKLDQVKERTTNMFQQCGGSGTVSPPYPDPPGLRETELKISTLESAYRSPHFASVPRHCVSDSNIYMHRDLDWYREPKPATNQSERLPISISSEQSRVDTITTRVQTPGNVLVRFRTFLGIDGGTVEVVTDNAECTAASNRAAEEGALTRMKNLFSARERRYNTGDGAGGGQERLNKKIKGQECLVSQQETVVGSEDRIIRMKTFFANKHPGSNTVIVESNSTTNGARNGFGKIKTLFKIDVGSQTEETSPADATPKGKSRMKLIKKVLGRSKTSGEEHNHEDPIKSCIDERQIFSRQSTLPAQSAHVEPARQLPPWINRVMRRMRTSCGGARVEDVEIPRGVVMDVKEPSRRAGAATAGSLTGWRWRHAEEAPPQDSWRAPRWKCPPLRVPPLSDIAATPFTQVIALICGILVVILMALGLSSADWLMAAGWRQGLFTHCVEEGAPTPLPFNLVEQPGCYASRDAGYIRAAAALCIVTLCADILGSILTAVGLRATDNRTKYKYYRLAVLAMSLALISILIALVIYPVCFAAELNLGNRTVWEFGWAYGVGWGAAIFLFGAVILLLCDKESEEIYYKERKVERTQPPGGA